MLARSQLMSDSDSSENFFSALDILSTAAVAVSADQDDHKAPTYADCSILICSIPETPCSSSSTPTLVIPAVVSPLMGQTLDPLSGSGTSPRPGRNTKSVVARRRSTGVKITPYDSDEEKHDRIEGEESAEDDSISPSFRHTSSGSSDGEGSDQSSESTVVEEQQPEFRDVLKMIFKTPIKKFVDMDILEIAAMKGIQFPRPRWWRPGGYDTQKDQRYDLG